MHFNAAIEIAPIWLAIQHSFIRMEMAMSITFIAATEMIRMYGNVREHNAFKEEGTTNILEMGGIVLEGIDVMIASDEDLFAIEAR